MIKPTRNTKVLQLSQKGHPYSYCPNDNKKKDNGYNKYKSSKEIKSTIKKLCTEMKKSKKKFNTLQAKIGDLKEE